MGCEIRKVPPNWRHPEKSYYTQNGYRKKYIPFFDEDVESAWSEWLLSYQDWVSRRFQEVIKDNPDFNYDINQPYQAFCDWNGPPPCPEFYRPRWTEDPTWYQVYETVSEGTPVTPPFATQEELIDYLCNHGTFWHPDQKWSRKSAENFVKKSGFMYSVVLSDAGIVDQTQQVI